MDIFSALAEPRRRDILQILAANGELSATDISDRFRVSPAAISQHLKALREARLVNMERRSQQRIYRINPVAMAELEGWAKQMMQGWNKRFDALDRVLQEESHRGKRRSLGGK